MILNRRLDLIEQKISDPTMGARVLRAVLLGIETGNPVTQLTELERRACSSTYLECLRRFK